MTNFRCFFLCNWKFSIYKWKKIFCNKNSLMVIASKNHSKLVRLLRFPFMQKLEKNQQKSIFDSFGGTWRLCNFCTNLKALLRSNVLLLLCFKRKTKKIFTLPCCSVIAFNFFYEWQYSFLHVVLQWCSWKKSTPFCHKRYHDWYKNFSSETMFKIQT